MINLNIPVNSLGYGVAAYNIWKELRKKTNITLWPVSGQITPPSYACNEQNLQEDINNQNNFNSNAPCLKIWHENHLAERIGNYKFFAYPFFEINKFDSRRISHLNSVDHLFVSSQWAKDIILDQTSLSEYRVTVAPCGVDTSIFFPTSQYNNSKCIFFNCGKWEIRKGHDILDRAFKDAFPTGNENVELWMMTSNPFLNSQEKYSWESKYNSDTRIKLIQRVQYQEQLAIIMQRVFCGVFPARAEGWNLELLEMMACGKYTISTNYSAHTEFCTSENCSLIDIVEEEAAYDGKWFKGDCGTWASLEGQAYDQLVHHLRDTYQLWLQNPESQNTKGIQTANRLSWENTANIIWEKIND